jgi:hypothetical protein
MPEIAAHSYSVAFGDFNRGYLIVDRQGVRVLRDPYSAKPYVLFYTTKRVGGGVQDFDAIKLKFGGKYFSLRHARACRRHPRFNSIPARMTWMAGTSPAMTRG